MYLLSDYDYTLPEHLIAQTPADPPESCKFLVYNKTTQTYEDKIFSDITTLIDPDTLIIFNNSKVVKARLLLKKEKSGFDGEIFYLNTINTHTFEALVRPGKKCKVGTTIQFHDDITFTVDALTHEGRQLTCSHPILHVLETYGRMPLPPYISYDESKADPYQPIFAKNEGSVAAPTASLHFTKDLIQRLKDQGIQTGYTTLHVGLGTFKQVDVEDIETYDIHRETIEIDLSLFQRIATHKLEHNPILAVGTTVTRTLESLPYLRKILSYKDKSADILEGFNTHVKQYRNTLTENITIEQAQKIIHTITLPGPNICNFESQLFLYPGKSFFVIDELITNFHLPKSSLLMLVSAFIGYDEMKKLYDHAIAEQYRFYSFGDAMRLRG